MKIWKADANRAARGDKVALTLKVEKGVVQDIRFKGAGCAISTASTSLMTEAVKGLSTTDVEALFKGFHKMVMGEHNGSTHIGKLEAFSGISEFPVRVKCATLAWHTLRAALQGSQEMISTE